MVLTAADIMETKFYTVHPETPIPDAVKAFKQAARKLERRVFGMMVVDEEGQLLGMISMYDILVLMRPKHIHIWGEMDDIDVAEFVKEILNRS